MKPATLKTELSPLTQLRKAVFGGSLINPMKTVRISKTVVSVLASCLLAAGAYAQSIDYSIGLKFGNGQVFWTPTPLQPTEVAGFLPQANWNNFSHNGSLGGTNANDGPVADVN